VSIRLSNVNLPALPLPVAPLPIVKQFQAVEDQDDRFFELFPHRFDYIYAEHPEPARSPNWQTERRYPLSSRIFQQGRYLFGVRFGAQTQYCVLDIDRGSTYHPQHDPLAISRIVSALEPIGLAAGVVCTSSYSGGLHLYFPFIESQNSWELAAIVTAQLENSGFVPQPGQLEVFPNPKPYVADGHPSLFNAHRLPMQVGSYLLDESFQPIWSDQQRFLAQWEFAQNRNVIDRKTVKRFLKQVKRTQFKVSGKADKFINDLNAEIEMGWTGSGQTNRLLGRIAMRAYIFHHVMSGGAPLEGKTLIDEIINTAQALPGYQDYCNHQHEIEQRAEEWARCVQGSRYFHYGDLKGKYKPKQETIEAADLPTWNQQQSESARDRICRAIADLLEKNSLPIGVTARFRALTGYGIGGGSLYRHRDLWHPSEFSESDDSPAFGDSTALGDSTEISQPVENPPDPPVDKPKALDRDQVASSAHSLTSLLSTAGGNTIPDKGLSDPALDIFFRAGNSSLSDLSSERFQPMQSRMQQYLASGDPILVAEALTWAKVTPADSAHELFSSLTSGNRQILQAQSSLIEPVKSHDDLSDTLAALSANIRQLGWSRIQVRENLLALFGKGDRALLEDEELSQWLTVLTAKKAALLELDYRYGCQ
jgi:hypothetical protein